MIAKGINRSQQLIHINIHLAGSSFLSGTIAMEQLVLGLNSCPQQLYYF